MIPEIKLGFETIHQGAVAGVVSQGGSVAGACEVACEACFESGPPCEACFEPPAATTEV